MTKSDWLIFKAWPPPPCINIIEKAITHQKAELFHRALDNNWAKGLVSK